MSDTNAKNILDAPQQTAPADPHRVVTLSLPASSWQEIEHELRGRGCWWLANLLVNTNSELFR